MNTRAPTDGQAIAAEQKGNPINGAKGTDHLPSTTRTEYSRTSTPTEPTPPIHTADPASVPAPKILRLVVLSSDILPTTPDAPRVAILDSREGGYYIGRDRSSSAPVLRLREMVVSKCHALVWYGTRESGASAGGGNGSDRDAERRDEKGFWIVDCGMSLAWLCGRVLIRS